MLVNIQGNIIDTEKIYWIGNCYTTNKYVGYGFDIHFLEGHSRTIEKYVKEPYGEKENNETTEKVEAARNQLIELWNSGKSTIPEIKL